MSEIASHEYWAEVESLAKETAAEHGYASDDAPEWIWETCDGHQWVIYTAYNFDVLKHSRNESYSVENFGAESVVKDGEVNWGALAFGAFYADVMEAYSQLEEPDEDAEV